MTWSASAVDADWRTAKERTAIEALIAGLTQVGQGVDHLAIKAAIEALNRGTEAFAGRRMDRSVRSALAGRTLDEVGA